MAEIVLINPPLYDTTQLGKLDNDEHWSPPLGIAYIASVLRKHNYDVKALDLYYVPHSKAKQMIEDEHPKIIGISCFSEQRWSSFELARYLRQAYPDSKIILGGPHSTFLYEQILTELPIDAIIMGEGEYTFLDFVEACHENRDWSAINGLAYLKDGKVKLNPPRCMIENLDELPFPDYSDFEQTKYAATNWFRNASMYGKKLKDMKWTAVCGSRGCAFNCSFCSTPQYWKRKWRRRSPNNIVDEIELLNKKYGYEFIDFADDIFTLDQQWTTDICNEMIRRNLKVLWSCCTRVDTVSLELLRLMKKAGCFFISFGVESFSSVVLTSVNKKITKQKILDACDLCKQVDLNIEFLLIVGSPGETDETIDETIQLINMVEPYAIAPSIMTIFPGTKQYDDAVADGFIDDSYWMTNKPCPYDTREHSLEVLVKWYHKLRDLDQIEKAERPKE